MSVTSPLFFDLMQMIIKFIEDKSKLLF